MTASPADRLWAAALGAIVLPAADRVIGQRMMRRFRYLNEAQWWPRERIVASRDAALAGVVQTAAAEVALYGDLYAAAGVDSRRIETAADLEALPIITKSQLRDGYPQRASRPTGQPTYDECTAGSTGEPLCVKEDADTAGWHRASFLQILSWAGWPLGAPHLQLGINPARGRGRAAKDRLLRCSYMSAYELDDAHLDAFIDRLAKHRIRYVLGYPVGVRELARRVTDRGCSIELDGVVTWGDMLDASARSMIETGFGARVLDAYGVSEGVWIASQCDHHDLYHVHMLDAVVELVDDEGRAVEPGTTGHVIVTRLHAGPTPLIRYRTGDLAVRSSEACPCGREYETISSVSGRSADTLVTPSGKRLIVHVFTGIFEQYRDISSFQVAKTDRDRIELRIVTRSDRGMASAEEAARRIEVLAPDMKIDVRAVDRIAFTSAGKRRFVIDETATRR